VVFRFCFPQCTIYSNGESARKLEKTNQACTNSCTNQHPANELAQTPPIQEEASIFKTNYSKQTTKRRMASAQPTDTLATESVQVAEAAPQMIAADEIRVEQTPATDATSPSSASAPQTASTPVLAPHVGVVVYSRDGCPYCVKSKDFLNEKSVPFTGVKLDKEAPEYPAQRDELISRTNHKTFPWVFVGDEFVGGYTELVRAFEMTRLHELLKGQGIELEEDLDF
jgi:glutaredoxin 3